MSNADSTARRKPAASAEPPKVWKSSISGSGAGWPAPATGQWKSSAPKSTRP